MKKFLAFLIALNIFVAIPVAAHQPVLEPQTSNDYMQQGLYFGSVMLSDPTNASQAVYGTIAGPDEYDLYAFVPGADDSIPVELLVPIAPRNENFKPTMVIIGKDIAEGSSIELPFALPDGYKTKEVTADGRDLKLFEPFSAERYYRSTEVTLSVKKDANYFIAIYDPHKQPGDYAIGVGTKEDFANVSKIDLVKNVAALKFGLIGDVHIPWRDLIGLFMLLSGLIIGLGAVTVIDIHGFLARHSSYWTSTTIRAHHVTKPLIWFGIMLVMAGGAIFYRDSWLNGVALFQAMLVAALVLNGLFLTFVISPRLNMRESLGLEEELLSLRMRNAIAVSFLVSFVGWWGNVALLVWYLLVQR